MTNKYAAFEKAIKVINSCTNAFHTMYADRYVANFDNLYNDYQLTHDLHSRSFMKLTELIGTDVMINVMNTINN